MVSRPRDVLNIAYGEESFDVRGWDLPLEKIVLVQEQNLPHGMSQQRSGQEKLLAYN